MSSSGKFQRQLNLVHIPVRLRDIDEETGENLDAVSDVRPQRDQCALLDTTNALDPTANRGDIATGTLHLLSSSHVLLPLFRT